MYQLFEALQQTAGSLWELFVAILAVIVPWIPLIAWIAFWLFAVNWARLRETLGRGGWIAIVLIGAIAVLVWGVVSPSSEGFDFFGLFVSNFVEKTIYVSGLVCIMFLAGALQLAGCCAPWCRFEEPTLIAEGHGDEHGHGTSHGHAGDHGHGHGH